MEFRNLHQPFIYLKNDNVNLIVSEFIPDKFEFRFGSTNVYENYWKLNHLDSNFVKTEIKTPKFIEYEGKKYTVIQECNGYVYNDKLTYIVGVHPNTVGVGIKFLLVSCDFDHHTKEIDNFKIHTTTRSGFLNENEWKIDKGFSVVCDNNEVINVEKYFDNVARIITVDNNHNLILITGYKDGILKTLVYDKFSDKLHLLNNKEGDNVYKSSIFNNESQKLIAYTKKIFIDTIEVDYLLNLDNEYYLNEFQK